MPTDPNPPGPAAVPPRPLPPEDTGAFRREMAFLRQRLARLQPPGPAAFATPITGDDPRARAMQAIEERSAVLHAPGPRPPVFGAPVQPEQPHLAALAPPPGLPSDFRQRRMHDYRQRRAAGSVPVFGGAPQPPLPAPANNWVPLGPSVLRQGQGADRPAVSGRVAGLAVAPGGQRVYAGCANGGVWRSDDGGRSWVSTMEAWDRSPTTTQTDSLSVGALALDPADPDRVYVGTGEGNTVWILNGQLFGSSAFYGVGPIRTDDGGRTWVPEATDPGSPSLQGSAFYELAIDPGDRERVLAATLRGLYRREPDGAGGWHWVQKLPGIFTSVRAARAGDATTFYAARWGGGVSRSADGHSWTSVPGFPTQNTGRVGLAVARNNPQVVYALAERADTSHVLGVWRLDAATGKWYAVDGAPDVLFGPFPNDPTQPGQGSYDLALVVDPEDVNRIYLGGSTVQAQGQWSGSAYRCAVAQTGTADHPAFTMTPTYVGGLVHADVHTLELTPDNPQQLWLGCDGGVFVAAEARGACQFEPRNTGLATLTMNHLAVHPTEDAVLFCGTQDNGHARYTGDEAWLHAVWGDGGYGVIHPRNPRRVLTTYVRGSVNRAEDGGLGYGVDANGNITGSWSPVPVPLEDEPVEFYAPLVGIRNPAGDAEADLVAFGSIRPWLSPDFGDTWASIPDGDLGADSLDKPIRSLAFPSANLLFAGTMGGGVWRFDRDGGVWKRKRLNATTTGAGALPFIGVPVTCVVPDPADAGGKSLYITLAGSNDYRHVWHFDGTKWEARSGPDGTAAAQLVDVQFNALVVDPKNPKMLYAGADIGVWRSQDAGANWERFSYGLPEASVLDLVLHPTRRLLWAATHGRGVYEYNLDATSALPVELYVRHTPLDRGRRPTDVDLPDPSVPDGAVDPLHSPDIKVDVPDGQGQYQTPTNQIDFYQFADAISGPAGICARSDAAGNPLTYRVYVQVHTRGVKPPTKEVRVLLLAAPAAGGIPPLPAGYATAVQTGNPITADPWRTAGTQTVAGLRVGQPRIAAFDLATSLLPPAAGGGATPCVLVALVHSDEDPYANAETDVKALSRSERRLAVQMIQVQP
jgi:hypothetical protein